MGEAGQYNISEYDRIYWTTRDNTKIGILSLHEKGITIYKSKMSIFKMIFGNKNLREELYANLNFDEILNVIANFDLSNDKTVRVFLTKDGYRKLISMRGGSVNDHASLNKTEISLLFFTNADSKDEILSFVDRANELIIKNRKN